jgi:2-methylcitrate dehydratase
MEMAFKSASSCGCTEAPVSAVREALKGEKLAAQDIEEIKLLGLPRLLYYNWDTLVEAEFSTPCAVALAVVGQEPGPDAYNTGRYKQPDIYEIARKINFDEDPRARELNLKRGQWTCTAEIKTRDGKVRKAYVDFEKGAPENPLTEGEIHHKFVVNSQGILGEKRAQELWDTLLNLEKTEKISALVPKFTRTK